MPLTGRCRCGAIRWTVEGKPERSSLCHCADCTRSAGAPMVGWAMSPEAALSVTGVPIRHESSPGTVRQFRGTRSTGLFYRNWSLFSDKVDVQTATLDDPDAVRWWNGFAAMPAFERWPG